MASQIKVFDFSLTADEAQGEKGLDFIMRLRPDWPKDKIVQKLFSGGVINCMMRFYRDDHKDDAIVVRIYGDDKAAKGMMARDNEIMVMQLAHHIGCFPPVLAFFENGIAYKFAVGRQLTSQDFVQPHTIRSLARALCGFHRVDLKACPIVDKRGKPATFDTFFIFYDDLRSRVNQLPETLGHKQENIDRLSEVGMNRSRLLEEFAFCEKEVEALDLPKSICHYDFHLRNGLYVEETGDVVILDLEMVKIGYEALDVGGLFLEGPWRGKVPNFFGEAGPPVYTEETKRRYAREYVIRRFELEGRNADDVTEEDVELQHIEHQVIAGPFLCNWLTLILGSMEAPAFHLRGIDFLPIIFEMYQEWKEEFPKLKAQYETARAKVSKR